METVVVDLGLGNLRSVEKAVAVAASEARVAAPVLTTDPDVVARASRVIVPGQGAFRDGAAALARNGGALGQALVDVIRRGTPYLGICLGLQLLLETSDEAPGARGLAVFGGNVARIPRDLEVVEAGERRRLKVPHMGWNRVHALSSVVPEDWYYFVHSYHAIADDPSIVAATCSYGCLEITAAVARGPLLATQFHPEKSQRAGLALLEGFFRRI